MKILVLNAGRGWGGIESHSVALCSALRDEGHSVILACRPSGHVERNAQNEGLRTTPLVLLNSGDPRGVFQIVRTARREGSQVVIANLGREYWPAALASLFCGIPVVFVRHQTDRIKSTTRWLISRHVSRVVAVSSAVRESLLRSGIPEEKIIVIFNGISGERFDPDRTDREAARRELGISPAELLIGTVGKLHRGKGVYELLHAVEAISAGRSVRLLYVGDGPEREAIEAEAMRSGIREKVVFAGVRNDVERMYAAMDIFVLPSTCDEAFGMVLIEAMAMGRPVVGTDVGGIPDIVSDGMNGILVAAGDEGALASALTRYMDDQGFRQRMADEGRRTVARRFSGSIMAGRYTSLLREVAGG